jgi:hypothetical protein
MPKTYAAVERKTAGTVMGAGSSRSLDNPFPIDPSLSKDLDLLSMMTARILSTPDIYDLSRPGACGDYILLMKKTYEKKLLPLLTEIETTQTNGSKRKEKTEILYQTSRKLVESPAIRKQICSDLMDTAIMTAAIVVACLGSIQVANQSREVSVASIQPLPPVVAAQKGGGLLNVRKWLREEGFISAENEMKTTIPLQDRAVQRDTIFHLTFLHTVTPIVNARLTVTSRSGAPMPTGSLKVQFMDPIVSISAVGTPALSMLPMRVIDNAGLPWMAGVLLDSNTSLQFGGGNLFKSFFPTSQPISPFLLWERLFRRTQKQEVPIFEERGQVNRANEVFHQLKVTQNQQPAFQIIQQFLAESATRTAAVPPPMYGMLQQPQQQQQPFGIPPPPFQPFARPQPYQLLQPQPGVALRPVIRDDVQYNIPLPTVTSITDNFKQFRSLLPVRSSPAPTRALTLASKINQDRTVQIGVCRDPYWTNTLEKTYPWITFQFLSVDDWSTFTDSKTGDRSKVKFASEWIDFLSELGNIYNGSDAPLLNRPKDEKFLDKMRFTDIEKMRICKDTPTPRVAFQQVQEGITQLQKAYEGHVKAVWALLNTLITVIQDPDTKQDIVRLHPNVFAGPSTSKQYVYNVATQARGLLKSHYIEVERVYVTTIRSLVQK